MSTELRLARKEATDLRHKVQQLAQEKIELESKIVPYRVRVVDLEALIKADAVKVKKLEQRSADRETLLGQVEKQVEELEQQNKGLKEQAEELEKQIEELKKQIEDLNLSSAQILVAGFEAAREQFACLFPDLDLSMVSLNNEVVDGKVVPAED
ncbi:uncharacterized protein [Phaseolus vulgaris]|uniref:uncharacterized protein n=1 Tax=Phaseolus vulgaris TaxID=3885 RepID=UPI0035CC0DA4